MKLDIATDGATARLVKVCQALAISERLPKSSAKALLAEAKAVRLFAEAQEPYAAKSALAQVEKFAGSIDDDADPDGSMAGMLNRHTERCRKVIDR